MTMRPAGFRVLSALSVRVVHPSTIAIRPAALIPAQTQLRTFSSSPLCLKKNKGSSSKSSKGKSRSTEDDEGDSAGSEDGSAGVVVGDVVEKVKGKMEKSVHWARAVIFEGVERGRGRVSPALLDSVRVNVPHTPGSSHLNAVASVTTKGNALYVEVWDTDTTKHVESAIHQANLPGISPQKTGANTLKIPISRPTVEQRAEILRSLADTVEGAKGQIRTARTDGFKALGGRKADGTDQIQKLADESVKDLEGQLSMARKEFEKA